jgi:alkylation response protein AidB-like acyl-CoA dehydrogenase
VRTILDDALNYATVISLAVALGCAQRALELSVEHAKNRVQFGRPIGAFQAIAHRCVDIRTDLDAIRMLCYQAAWALDNVGVATFEVSAAKAYANMAIRRIFTNAHQIHGAIGYSTEHDLPLYSSRGKTFELSFGSSALHQERVARAMGLTGSIDIH